MAELVALRRPPWWPLAEHSQQLRVGSTDWHFQRLGRRGAPVVLLLHGTGAGSHSFRQLAPLLARHAEVVVPDLPGHGYTQIAPSQALSLPAVAQALSELLQALQLRPALVVGHSAGAAVALRMALDGTIAPDLLVSINGAILPLQGPLGRLFLPAARLLVVNPLVPHAFATWAGVPAVARRLLQGTGSLVDAAGQRCYAELISQPAHVAGALRLMASWQLEPLAADLPRLHTPLLLLAGRDDRTLPASHAWRVHGVLPASRVVMLDGLGHLAHEEAAAPVAQHIEAAWRELRQGGRLDQPGAAAEPAARAA